MSVLFKRDTNVIIHIGGWGAANDGEGNLYLIKLVRTGQINYKGESSEISLFYKIICDWSPVP